MTLTGAERAVAALPRWAVLLLVALVARAVTFGNPVVHVDEEFYFVTARSMLDGALPFVDIWDRKPIGLFLLYAPAAALGMPGGIWAYQAMALASVVATALLIVHLARRAGWDRGALAAAAAYILWLNFLEGQGGQAPVFYNLLIAAAAALIAPRPDDAGRAGRRFGQGLAAMALVGLALQVKYSVVFEGMFFGLWWMWREHRLRRPVPELLAKAAALAVLAAAPTLIAWGSYAALGYGEAFAFANFWSIGARRPDPILEQLANLLKIVVIASPLLALAVLAWRGRRRAADADADADGHGAMQRWLFAWSVAAILGLLVFGSWFEHYALPMLVPLACCVAGFLSDHRHRRIAAMLLLGWGLVGGVGTIVGKRLNRGDAAQFAALAGAVGQGPGCLYVYSGTTMLYPATHRCRLTPYVFPSHLGRVRERGAIGVDQRAEIERILAARPQVVVVRAPYIGERPELRAMVLEHMARDYRLVAHRPMGRDTLSVYRRP